MTEINSSTYWEKRFAEGDWERVGGSDQTRAFAIAQCERFRLPSSFSGTLLDFGCGLGDAFPVYRQCFPQARLIGVDISKTAVEKCKLKYGELADFECCDYSQVPTADVMVASNVLEHLADDMKIVRHFKARCRRLFIIVPYREEFRISEHIHTYTKRSFDEFKPTRKVIYPCLGWTFPATRANVLWNIHFKNIARFMLRRPLARRRLQIMFEFSGEG